MIAQNHPTILFFVSINARNDVPDLSLLIIHVSLQTQLHVVRSAEVVSEWQAALESTRRTDRSLELREDRLRNVVSNRLHGYARHIGRFFGFQTLHSGNRGFTGRERIAGIIKEKLH